MDGDGEMTKGKILTAKDVKKLPSGAKVIRRGRTKDEVCTVVQYGKHKKLLYEDNFRGVLKYYAIRDEDRYEAL